MLEGKDVVRDIGVGVSFEGYLIIVHDCCLRQTDVLTRPCRDVERIEGEGTDLVLKLVVVEVGNRIRDMNFGEIELHELLYLKISCVGFSLVVDRKSKSLSYLILRNAVDLQGDSVWEAIA